MPATRSASPWAPPSAARLVRKFGQPAVLGELLIGVLAGNTAYWLAEPVMTVLREGETIWAVVHTALANNLSITDAARKILPDTEHTRAVISILPATWV